MSSSVLMTVYCVTLVIIITEECADSVCINVAVRIIAQVTLGPDHKAGQVHFSSFCFGSFRPPSTAFRADGGSLKSPCIPMPNYSGSPVLKEKPTLLLWYFASETGTTSKPAPAQVPRKISFDFLSKYPYVTGNVWLMRYKNRQRIIIYVYLSPCLAEYLRPCRTRNQIMSKEK